MKREIKKVLTIAGSDCSGGAGIQADLKTMTVHGVYGMSAITALTAQNTTGVYGIFESTPDFLASQLDCIFTDIFPDAVKIGMVSSAELVHVIAEKLTQYQAKNIVVDPVMVSTSGSRLMKTEATETVIKELMPLAMVVTPNIPEAEALSGVHIESDADILSAAKRIHAECGAAVLVKGGHLEGRADDLLYDGTEFWLRSGRVGGKNTHGTGCTLSSAIACNLAKGEGLAESVRHAKDYITGALAAGLELGSGNGPLNHCYLSEE